MHAGELFETWHGSLFLLCAYLSYLYFDIIILSFIHDARYHGELLGITIGLWLNNCLIDILYLYTWNLLVYKARVPRGA